MRTEYIKNGDNGKCFGNSALFVDLRKKDSEFPNCAKAVTDLVEPVFKTGDSASLAYDMLAAVIPAFEETMLIYDLNLRLVHEPSKTNALDQGYPLVRNLRRIPLPE